MKIYQTQLHIDHYQCQLLHQNVQNTKDEDKRFDHQLHDLQVFEQDKGTPFSKASMKIRSLDL